jgi:hypothetical protein
MVRSSLATLVVSCHVERPLDDETWARFTRFQSSEPGGFRIAALMRPPAPEAEKREDLWLDRVAVARVQAPVGHHTHFGGVAQARPRDFRRGRGPAAPRSRVAQGQGRGAPVLVRRRLVSDAGDRARPHRLRLCGLHSDRLPPRVPANRRAPRPNRGAVLAPAPGWTPTARAPDDPLARDGGQTGADALPITSLPVHVYFHDWDLMDVRRADLLRGLLSAPRRSDTASTRGRGYLLPGRLALAASCSTRSMAP